MECVNEVKVKHDITKRELVSGKGTAIIMKKDIETQPARKGFNNEKTIVHIINLYKESNNNLIVAAHQAPNGVNKYKWDEILTLT